MPRNKGGRSKTVNRQQVRQMINNIVNQDLERKYILTATGTTITPASITNSGTVYSLDTVATGTSNQTRVGNNATVKEILVNMNLYPDSTDVINVFRVVLVRWNDNTTLVAGDIFTSTNYSTSYYNIDNIKTNKMHILWDKSYCTGYTSSGAKHCYINLKQNHSIQWNTTSSANAIQGALYLFVVSDSTAVPSPTIAGNVMVLLEQ